MEDLVSSCDYTYFLEKDKKKKKKCYFFSVLKNSFTKKTRKINSYVVLVISCILFFCFSFFFIFLHTSFSIEEEIGDILPINRQIGRKGEEEKKGQDTRIWKWKEEKFEYEFNEFVNKYNKIYVNEEEKLKRYAIFKKNLYYIHTHNEASSRWSSSLTYLLRMNEFGDLTFEEFKKRFLGFQKNKSTLRSKIENMKASELLKVTESDLPSSVNWKIKKCVSDVKNQKQCGSCWAFSAVGAIEGAICAKTGNLYNLSEQQLVDCDNKENNGCNGGDMDSAFEYIVRHKGLCTDIDYPYNGNENKCKQKQCKNTVEIQGFKDVPRNNELAICAALHKYGPVAVAIDANKLDFQFYHKGIFNAECGNNLNHGVILVAYKRNQNKKSLADGRKEDKKKEKDKEEEEDYFEIKNSWGSDWGENGFMRLSMHKGKKGQCGILLGASVPIV